MLIDVVLEVAEEVGLDLVEVLFNVDLFVCKIVDYGKLKYQEQKKKVEVKKKQKIVEIKEIKMCLNIDVYDYGVKIKVMMCFFEVGDKVKVILCFWGCEMVYQNCGMEIMNWVKEDFVEIVKVEFELKMEGCFMVMVMVLCQLCYVVF